VRNAHVTGIGMNNDLLNVGTHFSFGENWADFAQSVDEDRVRQAELDLTRIVGDVRGKSFLDIGCNEYLFTRGASS
jgi:2-polyprenyl-6-hydroxyphenyl methylase/3-demethylubiquinone-9 3-methyltransferase